MSTKADRWRRFDLAVARVMATIGWPPPRRPTRKAV